MVIKMKKPNIYTLFILGLSTIGFCSNTVAGEPTRMFTLEQGATAEQGSISIDLYDSIRNNQQIRTGIWGGEAMISQGGMGYKQVIIPNLAVYGQVAINTADGADSSFIAGGSYTLMPNNSVAITGSVELGNTGADNDFALGIGAGAYFTLPNAGKLNKIKLGGELLLSSADDTEVGIQLGVRWLPRDNITVDLLIFNNDVSKATEGALQTPAGIRANLSF